MQKRVRSGSVIETNDGLIWYVCGKWSLSSIPNSSFPCMLGYVPQPLANTLSISGKALSTNGRYIKVFTLPIAAYRNLLKNLPKVRSIPHLGKIAFVDQQHIAMVRDPINFSARFLKGMPKEKAAVRSLCRLLKIPSEALGISGSALVIGTPVRRHEIDIIIYGKRVSQLAWKGIQRCIREKVFSRRGLGALHLRFRHKGVVFDPQFSDSESKCFLHGCSLKRLRRVANKSVRITSNRNSLFFPAKYLLDDGSFLISFRVGHRALFHVGDQVDFSALSRVRLGHPDGRVETGYGILDEEWGMIHWAHK